MTQKEVLQFVKTAVNNAKKDSSLRVRSIIRNCYEELTEKDVWRCEIHWDENRKWCDIREDDCFWQVATEKFNKPSALEYGINKRYTLKINLFESKRDGFKVEVSVHVVEKRGKKYYGTGIILFNKKYVFRKK